MAKKPTLGDFKPVRNQPHPILDTIGSEQEPTEQISAPAPPPPPPPEPKPPEPDLQKVNFQIRPEADYLLNVLKLEGGKGTTRNALIAEALNLLFKKKGKSEIA